MSVEKPDKQNNGPVVSNAASAPELPVTVAKEYGLHHIVRAAEHKAGMPDTAEKSEADASDDSAGAEDTPLVSNPKIDAAVDDIIAKEGDALLAVQDASADVAAERAPQPHGFWGRIGAFFKAWWQNPWARWTTVIVLFLTAGTVALIPNARYFVLNTAGVRSSVNVIVTDEATHLPLKNVAVTVGGQTAYTDVKGHAQVKNVKLGSQELRIKRLAFASLTRYITVGWGSNPLGQLALKATGLQYHIEVRDYVSDKPLVGAEASNGDLNALADKDGRITLTVSSQNLEEITIRITKAGYRSEALKLKPTAPSSKVHLVPAAKEFFVSNASGKYDLYAMDLDGKDKRTILAGTGNENGTIALGVAPAGDWAATVSSRDGARSKDGFLLRGITLVSADGATASTIERAEQIKLIDWIGTKIIYQVTVASASAANNQRNRLISYDYTTNTRVQLATANQFNGVHSVGGILYYAIAATDPSVSPALMKIRPDGTGRQTLWGKEVWTIVRVGLTTLALQTQDGWFKYLTATGGTPAKDNTVPDASGRQYIDNADRSKAALVDFRDGKGTIIVTATAGGTDTRLAALEGAAYPLRWLNDTTIVFRVVSGSETADYAVSTLGGQPRKVTDLTNTFGFIQQ
jgi:hypothetical protein